MTEYTNKSMVLIIILIVVFFFFVFFFFGKCLGFHIQGVLPQRVSFLTPLQFKTQLIIVFYRNCCDLCLKIYASFILNIIFSRFSKETRSRLYLRPSRTLILINVGNPSRQVKQLQNPTLKKITGRIKCVKYKAKTNQ